MIETDEMKVAYQELISVLELEEDDHSPVTILDDITEDELIECLRDAGELINPKKDNNKISKSTIDVLSDDDITTPEIKKILSKLSPKEEKKNPGKKEEPEEKTFSDEDLFTQIEEAKSRAVLVNIAKVNDVFNSVIDEFGKYKTKEELQDFMLDTLDTENEKLSLVKEPVKETEKKKETKKEKPVKPVKQTKIEPVERILEDVVYMDIRDIKSEKPFNSIFNINPDVLSSIVSDMIDNGYDQAFPVILWNDIIIDGHTRLNAAITAEINTIPTISKAFADEKEALEYAIHNQRNRRNLSEAELLHCIELLDKPLSKKQAGSLKGSKDKGKSNFENKIASEPTHKKTAKVLGIGQSKVSDARTVLKDAKAKKEVESGKKTISKAAKEIREKTAKPTKKETPKLDMIVAVVETLRDYENKKVEIDEVITVAYERLYDANGKSVNAKAVGNEVKHAIDVLTAFGWITKIGEGVIQISE